jgi:hypothetical protein
MPHDDNPNWNPIVLAKFAESDIPNLEIEIEIFISQAEQSAKLNW